MHSCIYVGQVRHRRFVPVAHRFQYRFYMAYLDLDELPEISRLLPRFRFAPLSFRQQDHVANSSHSLADTIRDLIDEKIGRRPDGPIRLLTGLRCFGYYFSPLNLYYCFDTTGNFVETVVAEVSNTPWRETHYYVLSAENRTSHSGGLRFAHPKGFHVSPFMQMNMEYHWQLSQPGSRLAVQITNRSAAETTFKASFALERQELGRWQLARLLIRFPWMTARIMLAIYYQAYKLWRKKCPFHPHPRTQQV